MFRVNGKPAIGIAGPDRHLCGNAPVPSVPRFVAILGILSLLGMIARNAVILIEQIDFELARGLDAWSAVIEASVSRFRPIMLTAISTVLGLIPIAVTIFWGPMVIAVMAVCWLRRF
jgi:multidrug efflux pump subunit AcrB